MRDEVLEFLRQNQGSFVSGQDMSEAWPCFAYSYLETYQGVTSKRLQNRILYQEGVSIIGGT